MSLADRIVGEQAHFNAAVLHSAFLGFVVCNWPADTEAQDRHPMPPGKPALRANDHTGRVRAGTVGYVAAGRWLRPFVTGLVRFDRDGSLTRPSTATSGAHSPV